MENAYDHYEAGSFFIVRSPLFAVDRYLIAPEKDSEYLGFLDQVVTDEYFNEAIKWASPDLYKMVMDFLEKGKPLTVNAYKSISNYFIRMTTRPTPFGLFSGIGMGFCSDKNTSIIVDKESPPAKYLRVDRGWLDAVIKKNEDNNAFIINLKVLSNPNVYISGNRLINPCKSSSGKLGKDSGVRSSIRLSPMVKSVLEKTKRAIQLKDLTSQIIEENSSVPMHIVVGFLMQLIKEEFLIHELRSQILNVEPLAEAASIIEKFDPDEGKSLYNCIDNIKKYEVSPIGKSLNLYTSMLESMKQVSSHQGYLQLDTKLAFQSCSISENHMSQLEESVSYLVQLAKYVNYPRPIDSYTNEFKEKYGVNTFVPILEILDDNLGLGAPAGYMFPPTTKEKKMTDESFKSPLKNFIRNKALFAVKNNDIQIRLDERDLETIKRLSNNNSTYKDIPYEIEMNFFVSWQPEGEIQFIVGPNWGSNSVGNSFGRFTHLFDSQELKQVDSLYSKKHKVYEDEYIIIEIQEATNSGKHGNIMSSLHTWTNYTLALGNIYYHNNDLITLHDIYVGVDRSLGTLCLYSKKHKKKIFAQMSSMLNPISCNNISRFMLEVTHARYVSVFSLFGDFNDNISVFSPRILHNNVVVSPASWIISKAGLCVEENSSREEINLKVKLFLDQWAVPKYVYIKELDNLLLVNTANQYHVNEIIRRIQKGFAPVQLQEAFLPVNEKNSTENKYISEITVPFFQKKSDIKDKTSNNFTLYCNSEICHLDRNFVPFGSDWIYLKLYYDVQRCDEVLNSIESLCKELSLYNVIKSYFFIRYFDKEPHIRLRLKLTDVEHNEKAIPLLSKWSSDLYRDKLIHHLTYDIYEREIERYGGKSVIELAEQFFCSDSNYVLNLLKLEKAKKLNYVSDICAIMSIISILDWYPLSFAEQIAMLERFRKPEYLKHFREYRKDLMALRQHDAWFNEITKEANFEHLHIKRGEDFKNYATSLKKQDNLTNTASDILLSVVHMFCNRFKGELNWEQKIMSMTYSTLYSYKNFSHQYTGRNKESV